MEPWAQRIESRLAELAESGLNEAGIAKVCGIAKNSVSQWFGRVKGKPPTKQILGQHLVATAAYLKTTAEWIMTGRGVRDASHFAGIDPDTLGSAFVAADKALRAVGLKFDAAIVPKWLIYAYQERLQYPADADKTILAAYDRHVQAELERGRFSERKTDRSVASGGAQEHEKAAAARPTAGRRGRTRGS